MLSLSLLGRPVLAANGQPVSLTIRKTWAPLVLLALSGAAPRPRVGAALWPGLDESTARRNLRRELARLREAGVPGLLQAEGDFLVLHPAAALDTQQFDAAVAAGQPAQALALWRGPLADGLSTGDTPEFDDWLAAERERWRARWRGALEAAAAAAEQADAPDQAITHLQTLLADDPLHERHHAAVMRLHGVAGRREAALAQYERCRAVLAAELGLQPMADTEALAAALRGAAVGGPAPQASATAASPTAGSAFDSPGAWRGRAELPESLPFVGRSAEVAALEAAWQAGRAVLIEGEGGVGKTRLALDFAAAHGPYALARSRPGDADVPYAAFTRALRALAGPTPQLQGQPSWVIEELSRLLPELGPAPQPIRSGEERSRFFEACARGWLALASDNFDAVLLDDWHHADAASRSLLAFVARRRRETEGEGGAREWLLLRPELDPGTLQQLLAGMQALHLPLQPLPGEAVFDLVQRLSGARQPRRFAARLQQVTAGNPFFLAETLRHLAEQRLLQVDADGHWRTPFDDATQDYRELPVPASVVDAVLARVQRLPGAARRVLEAAALAVEPFAPALLAPACALSEIDTVLAIEQAVQAQLLREHDNGGYAFAHDLVQQALDGSLSADRRRLLHRRLALGAEAAGAEPGVVAAHFEASGEPQRAVPWRLAAGEQALRLHALVEAAQQWLLGLADQPTTAQALALRLRLVRATRMLLQREDSLAHGRALLALAEDPALSPQERAEAVIVTATNLVRVGHAAQGLALLDGFAPPAAAQQARALDVQADALRRLGRMDEARAAAQAALAMPELQGADRANLLFTFALVEHLAGQPQAAIAHVDQAVPLYVQLRDEIGAARGEYMRGTFRIETGELARAEAELQAVAERCGRSGVFSIHRASLHGLHAARMAQGRYAQALWALQQGWTLPPALTAGELRWMYLLGFVDAHGALGDLGGAWEHASTMAQEAQDGGDPMIRASMAAFSSEILGLLGAGERIAAILAPVDGEQLLQLRLLGPDVHAAQAQLALAAGQAGAARALLPDALPTTPRVTLARAALALVEGDAVTAQARLVPDDAAGLTDELRLRWLALRLQVCAAAGSLPPALLRAAVDALTGTGAHALAALALVRAWRSVARSARASACDGAAVAALDSACAARVAAAAATLAAHPAQRSAFLNRHA